MTGLDLRCWCGAGAADVDPYYEIPPEGAIKWRCMGGHTLISGSRPGYEGFQQMCVNKPAATPKEGEHE